MSVVCLQGPSSSSSSGENDTNNNKCWIELVSLREFDESFRRRDIDLLVVSSNNESSSSSPSLSAPTIDSLLLKNQAISLQSLSIKEDLTDSFHCWISTRLPTTKPFRQLLVLEQKQQQQQQDDDDDVTADRRRTTTSSDTDITTDIVMTVESILSTISITNNMFQEEEEDTTNNNNNNNSSSSSKFDWVAIPMSLGHLLFPADDSTTKLFLQAILRSTYQWIDQGLQLKRLTIIMRNDDNFDTTQQQQQQQSIFQSECQRFVRLKQQSTTNNGGFITEVEYPSQIPLSLSSQPTPTRHKASAIHSSVTQQPGGGGGGGGAPYLQSHAYPPLIVPKRSGSHDPIRNNSPASASFVSSTSQPSPPINLRPPQRRIGSQPGGGGRDYPIRNNSPATYGPPPSSTPLGSSSPPILPTSRPSSRRGGRGGEEENDAPMKSLTPPPRPSQLQQNDDMEMNRNYEIPERKMQTEMSAVKDDDDDDDGQHWVHPPPRFHHQEGGEMIPIAAELVPHDGDDDVSERIAERIRREAQHSQGHHVARGNNDIAEAAGGGEKWMTRRRCCILTVSLVLLLGVIIIVTTNRNDNVSPDNVSAETQIPSSSSPQQSMQPSIIIIPTPQTQIPTLLPPPVGGTPTLIPTQPPFATQTPVEFPVQPPITFSPASEICCPTFAPAGPAVPTVIPTSTVSPMPVVVSQFPTFFVIQPTFDGREPTDEPNTSPITQEEDDGGEEEATLSFVQIPLWSLVPFALLLVFVTWLHYKYRRPKMEDIDFIGVYHDAEVGNVAAGDDDDDPEQEEREVLTIRKEDGSVKQAEAQKVDGDTTSTTTTAAAGATNPTTKIVISFSEKDMSFAELVTKSLSLIDSGLIIVAQPAQLQTNILLNNSNEPSPPSTSLPGISDESKDDTALAPPQQRFSFGDNMKIIALITPNYVMSVACLSEFLKFKLSCRSCLQPLLVRKTKLPNYMQLVQYHDASTGRVDKIFQALCSIVFSSTVANDDDAINNKKKARSTTTSSSKKTASTNDQQSSSLTVGDMAHDDDEEEEEGTNLPFDVFISYSHQYHKQALAVEEILQFLKPGISCFLDVNELHAGVLWQQKIYRSLDRSRIILFLVTPPFLTSTFCREETAIGYLRAIDGGSKLICVEPIPILQSRRTDIPRVLQKATIAGETVFQACQRTVRVLNKLQNNTQLSIMSPLDTRQMLNDKMMNLLSLAKSQLEEIKSSHATTNPRNCDGRQQNIICIVGHPENERQLERYRKRLESNTTLNNSTVKVFTASHQNLLETFDTASKLICLLSNHFLSCEFCLNALNVGLLRNRADSGGYLIPIAVKRLYPEITPTYIRLIPTLDASNWDIEQENFVLDNYVASSCEMSRLGKNPFKDNFKSTLLESVELQQSKNKPVKWRVQ